MSEISLKFGKIGKIKFVATIAMAAVLAILPLFALSSHTDKIYVDDSVSGIQDGSSTHPFKTIERAIEAASGDTEIHVAKGNYKENITVKMDVKIFGESKSGVVVEAKNENQAVVTMKNRTKINKLTIKGGKYGVKVKDKAKASIINCVIKNNERDGLNIERRHKRFKNDFYFRQYN